MNTNSHFITVAEIPVEVVRKDIKNLHLGVYPPEGSVRVSAPQHFTDDNVRLAVVSRLSWVKKQQKEFQQQPRQAEREFVSGESHYFQGKRYLLEVIEKQGRHSVYLNGSKMVLQISPDISVEKRALIVNNWYREQLKLVIPQLLEKWQPIIGKSAESWGVKKMKTKWGSCNASAKRIWLNLELAKKPFECLEYILVHELVHLHERHHNDQFKVLMDQFLPNWRISQKVLNKSPLAHEEWKY